jgi:hypothetical protein
MFCIPDTVSRIKVSDRNFPMHRAIYKNLRIWDGLDENYLEGKNAICVTNGVIESVSDINHLNTQQATKIVNPEIVLCRGEVI